MMHKFWLRVEFYHDFQAFSVMKNKTFDPLFISRIIVGQLRVSTIFSIQNFTRNIIWNDYRNLSPIIFFYSPCSLLYRHCWDSVSGVKAIMPAEMTRLINHDNAVVIDIRPQEEFVNGHVINSISYPLANLESGKDELNKYKDKPLVLYCQNGVESSRVIRTFRQEGFSNIYVLKGGIQAWKNANMPVMREET